MKRANNNVNKAKNPVEIFDAKVVGITTVPCVVNSSEYTSEANPKIGSWLLANHKPVYLVALVKSFNSMTTDLPSLTNGKKTLAKVPLESFPILRSFNVGLV